MSLKRVTGLLVAAALVTAAPAAGATGNGRLAYGAGGSIYSIDPAGGAARLVHEGFLPAFSPDGTKIAFDELLSDGSYEIVAADADGSNAGRIGTNQIQSKLVWSPDGTRVAFISGSFSSGFGVAVARADGGGSAMVSLDASPEAPPSWSPDGTELAFTTTSNTDIAVAKADGSGRRLLIEDATQDMAPSWAPDGSKIAFLRGTFGSFLLYTIRPDGSGLHQLGRTSADPAAPPAWSPDSSRLVFGGREQVGYWRYGPSFRSNVFEVGADGAGERRLTDSGSFYAGANPGWSPDGRRIAFMSIRQQAVGGPQIYVMNSDGSCETQVTSGIDQPSTPTWQAQLSASPANPLQCAALSLTGSLAVTTEHPALDDARVYVYQGVITNNGNVNSDPLQFVTADESPFSYISATASNGACTLGARASCTLPSLPPGGTITIELRFTVFVVGTFEIEPEVEATGNTPDGDLSDNADDQYRQFPFCEISTQHGATLRAGGDDDLICGTIGADAIFTGGGNNHVLGGPGRDVVRGGADTDQVDGDGGTDFVYGEGGGDRIHGADGDDVLIGGGGSDILWGDNGGDFLRGGPGADRFFGGYGNDLIDSRDGRTEHVYCGEGNDRVEADLRDIVHACEKVVRRPVAQAPAPR
jgi:Tol biopolymer transport system component